MILEEIDEDVFLAFFTDEEAPRTVEEFTLRLDELADFHGDYITFVLGEQDIDPELLQWLRDQPTHWFESYGVYGSEEFLSDDYRS